MGSGWELGWVDVGVKVPGAGSVASTFTCAWPSGDALGAVGWAMGSGWATR